MKEYKMPFDFSGEVDFVNNFMEATEWLDSGRKYTTSRKTCVNCGRNLPDTEFPRHRRDKICYLCLKGFLDVNEQLNEMFYRIKARCINPNHSQYSHYGGRNIKCKFDLVQDFINYVKNYHKEYSPGYEIHRIDNNGNYEPGNIRFVPWIVHVNIHKE